MTPATLSTQQLYNDDSRCHGYATEPRCQVCVRRLQIERDKAQDSGRFFWQINPALVGDECRNFIEFKAPL
jgi:hypothetical protein